MSASDRNTPAGDLGQLVARYLERRQAEAGPELEAAGEVELHQASQLLMLDPLAVLADAWFPAQQLAPRLGVRAGQFRPPPDWVRLVRHLEPVRFLPCCLGSFPQLVRDPQAFLNAGGPEPPPVPRWPTLAVGEVEAWGWHQLRHGPPHGCLFAMATLRLAGQTDAARRLLDALAVQPPPGWDLLLANERAALEWFAGAWDKAEAGWSQAPLAQEPVGLFNRGLSALGRGRNEAAALFAQAAAAWPESNPWHHLAQAYRAFAEEVCTSR
jgi:hypothetical protein